LDTSANGSVISSPWIVAEYDALLLAGGATIPRDLDIPGRQLQGVHQAMDYLKPANQVQEGTLTKSSIDAAGKQVIIIGGGDTGADCLGTAHRQGARSVHQLEIMPEPSRTRGPHDPWPTWPNVLRTYPAHEEGGERLFSVSTAEFLDNGAGTVRALRAQEVRLVPGAGRPSFAPVGDSQFELPCQLVFLALGFSGPERTGVMADLGLSLSDRGTVMTDRSWKTNVESVFACGDMTRGQSLIVWAIAEGRSAAAAVDKCLMGETDLPVPVVPGQLSMR
jgi:glutamate synthase (NADPH/NADH) small chain